MDRREQRSAGMSRVGVVHDDDGSFDRQFWARIPAAERLALVWDMTLESLEWRRQSGGEPDFRDLFAALNEAGARYLLRDDRRICWT